MLHSNHKLLIGIEKDVSITVTHHTLMLISVQIFEFFFCLNCLLGIGFFHKGTPELIAIIWMAVHQLVIYCRETVIDHHVHPFPKPPEAEVENSCIRVLLLRIPFLLLPVWNNLERHRSVILVLFTNFYSIYWYFTLAFSFIFTVFIWKFLSLSKLSFIFIIKGFVHPKC